MNVNISTVVPFSVPMTAPVVAILASLLVGLALVLLLLGLVQPWAVNPMRGRLARFATERPVTPTLEEIELQKPFIERVVKPIVLQASHLITRFTPGTQVDAIQMRLAQAGNPRDLTVEGFFGLKGLMAVVGGAGTALALWIGIPGVGTLDALHSSIYTVLGVVVGFFLPDLWLKDETRKRRKKIQRALPDTIDILSISVEAGLAFDAAIARLVAKAKGPLIDEFEKYLLEVRLGRPRRDSMRLIATRAGVDDVNTFISAILQADQLGVSIAKVLRVQSEQMRVRRRQRAQALAMKAPVKMLFPMLLFIFPSIFVVILGPAIPQVMNSGFGR